MALADSALPWPVSKYITLSPMVPRLSDSAAACASSQAVQRHAEESVGLLGAGDRLEHQVDRRAFFDRGLMVLVTWVSTQPAWGCRSAGTSSSMPARPARGSCPGRVDADHRIAAP
jgi:hypothetical protein